ncbi:CLUMA_CG007138, isoform A [Clunio marinus]|uniref:Carbohydrate sulfotransferase n=1 Tax=Clunio marinus TaxID=568069 RepID=A0A1J1HZT2_9DIPT|nr:CLUMA_CG007138, isoform A [Clunio marinus]
MLKNFYPRKVKMFCMKRPKNLVILKAVVFVFVMSLYFIVLIKESMNVIESNAKLKTVTASKVDNSKQKHHFHQRSVTKHKPSKNHHNATLKPPESYLIPNPKFHKQAKTTKPTTTTTTTEKSSFNQSATIVVDLDAHRSTTLNPVYEYSEEINAKAEKDFIERRQHLHDVCEKNKILGKITPNAWEFFISPGHGLAWCNVFKAASTTWMYYFNLLAGYDPKYLQKTITTPLELARKRFPRPNIDDLNEAVENSITFLVVREPFERLLSAYRNKMEDGKNPYYKLLGDQIVKKFRTMPITKIEIPGPTFNEFLQFVVQHYKSGGRFDEHWSPIYQFCTPCSINFTLIAKMETFQRDTEYIIRQAGLETLLLNKVPKTKEDKITNRSSINNTNTVIEKYFSQIDENLLKQILEIYQLDFDLFNYDSTRYLKMVQKSENNDSKFKLYNRLDFGDDVNESKVFS